MLDFNSCEPFPLKIEVLTDITWTLRSNCCSFPVGQFQDFSRDLLRIRCLECFYCIGVITREDKNERESTVC